MSTYPHQELLESSGIAVTDLPEKTQKLISKFHAKTEEEKEALDEKIHGDVEDYIEAKAAKEKADAKKASYEAAKKKLATRQKDASQVNISDAPTAGGNDTTNPEKKRSVFDFIYGRK